MFNLIREKLARDQQSEDASINSDDRSENDATSQVGIQESLKETPGAADPTVGQG
jgi:hypothetical protein